MDKRKKIRSIMLVSGLLVLGIGISGYYIYRQAGDYVIKGMLEKEMVNIVSAELGIDLNEPSRPLTQEEKDLFKHTDVQEKQQHVDVQEATKHDKEVNIQGNTTSQEEAKGDKEVSIQGDTTSEEDEKDSAKKPAEKAKEPYTTGELKKMVQEQVEELAKVIPQKDKNAMTNLVLQNVSMKEIKTLASMAIDGLSQSELQYAKEVAKSSFDQQELVQVRNYYAKYKHLIP